MVEGQPETITVTAVIVRQGEMLYKIDVSSIAIKNIGTGYSAKIGNQTVEVVLRGTVEGFEITSLQPYVDLAEAVEGENQILLKFESGQPTGVEQASQVWISVTLTEDIP
jgi:hypothetical protein